MTPIQVAITDDEPLARARLKRLLAKVGGENVRVIVEAADVDELLAAAAKTPLDLVFLDIEMPGGDGFTALKRWPGARPHVVFVTAYQEHGVRAFDARALDYLVKPVAAARLEETLNRAIDAIRAKTVERGGETRPARISLQIGNRRDLVTVHDISLIVARGNYLEVHVGKREYMVRNTLGEFHASLRSEDFVRLHRSMVVRRSAIRTITPAGSGRYRLELDDGQKLHTGRNFREHVQKLMS